MSGIRSTITIDLDDDNEYLTIVDQIKSQLSSVTGNETIVTVKVIDDPISLSTSNYKGRFTE